VKLGLFANYVSKAAGSKPLSSVASPLSERLLVLRCRKCGSFGHAGRFRETYFGVSFAGIAPMVQSFCWNSQLASVSSAFAARSCGVACTTPLSSMK